MLNFLKSKAGNMKGLQEASKGTKQKEMPFPHLCIYFNDKQKIQMPRCFDFDGAPKPRLWGVGKKKETG